MAVKYRREAPTEPASGWAGRGRGARRLPMTPRTANRMLVVAFAVTMVVGLVARLAGPGLSYVGQPVAIAPAGVVFVDSGTAPRGEARATACLRVFLPDRSSVLGFAPVSPGDVPRLAAGDRVAVAYVLSRDGLAVQIRHIYRTPAADPQPDPS